MSKFSIIKKIISISASAVVVAGSTACYASFSENKIAGQVTPTSNPAEAADLQNLFDAAGISSLGSFYSIPTANACLSIARNLCATAEHNSFYLQINDLNVTVSETNVEFSAKPDSIIYENSANISIEISTKISPAADLSSLLPYQHDSGKVYGNFLYYHTTEIAYPYSGTPEEDPAGEFNVIPNEQQILNALLEEYIYMNDGSSTDVRINQLQVAQYLADTIPGFGVVIVSAKPYSNRYVSYDPNNPDTYVKISFQFQEAGQDLRRLLPTVNAGEILCDKNEDGTILVTAETIFSALMRQVDNIQGAAYIQSTPD
jgi:hypothetical protein